MHLHTYICNEILQVENSQGHFISILIWLLENYKYLSNVATGNQDDCTSAFQWGSLFSDVPHSHKPIRLLFLLMFDIQIWSPQYFVLTFAVSLENLVKKLINFSTY